MPLPEIARDVGLSKGRVSTIAKSLGLPQRQPRPDVENRKLFRRLYAEGLTVAEIATRTGWHRDTVGRALRKAGVRIRSGAEWARRWPIHHQAFSSPMSAEAWYWIGLLAADGYVRGASIALNMKCSSEPVLRRFMAFVGSPNRPLRPMNHGRAWGAQVSSPRLVVDLARHGVVTRKSYSLKTSVEAAREPSFWLGVFDGDGCITMSRKGAPIIGVVGTRALMGQFADFLETRITGARPAVVRCGADQDILWQVRAGGDRARQLAELWLASSPVSLEAKRARLERASVYESRATRARLAVRERPCDFCGAWVRRMPSQLHRHVFCSRRHYWAWRAQRRRPRDRSVRLADARQLQFSSQGL
jgi:hypothetical protein